MHTKSNQNRHRRVLGLLLAALGAGVIGAATAADPFGMERARMLAPLAHTGELPVPVKTASGAYIAYYTLDDSNNQLRVKDLGNDEPGKLVYQLPPGPNKSSGIEFAAEGDHRYLQWRPKFATRKDLYFARQDGAGGEFSEPQLLNRDHNALNTMLLRAGPNGLVVSAWQDERRGQPRDIYLNISHDGGKTFLPEDIWISRDYDNASTPALLVEGREIHAFFVGKKALIKKPAVASKEKDAKKTRKGRKPEESEFYVVHRRSLDGGKTWDERRIAQTAPSTAADLLTPVRMSGSGRLWLYYREGYEGLKAVYSDDNGNNWRSSTLPPPAAGEYIMTLSVAATRDTLHLAYTSSFLDNSTIKPDVFILQGRDRGNRWDAPRRLSTEPHRLTQSLRPQVTADDSGRVVAVWTDFRNIRSNVYLNYSTDFGATWLAKDMSIEGPGRYNSDFPQLLDLGGGRYEVVYRRYIDDRLKVLGLWGVRLTLAAPQAKNP